MITVTTIIRLLLESRAKEVWINLSLNNKMVSQAVIEDINPVKRIIEAYDYNAADGADMDCDGFSEQFAVSKNKVTGQYYNKVNQTTYDFEIFVDDGTELMSLLIRL